MFFRKVTLRNCIYVTGTGLSLCSILVVIVLWGYTDIRPEELISKEFRHSTGYDGIVHELVDFSHLPSFLNVKDLVNEHRRRARKKTDDLAASLDVSSFEGARLHCQMNNCFQLEKCRKDFKVYVYPVDPFIPMSSTYDKILTRIKASNYYTNDPVEACLFVLSIDTLDRDELSRDFVRSIPSRLIKLELWNNGENHIIFNLYAGTWPNYNETEMGFNPGKAILAKASMSATHFRPGFDISLPLFHPSHSDKGDDTGTGNTNEFPSKKRHLVAFKGKRYVYGIGSETRNSVYHLHNGNDSVMVTTCKHGKNWKEMKDERCDEDNKEFEKYDYETLLLNSTFCLIPRGRRLGSFRFLEALKAGCIPVVFSNGWILPFSETIDWKSATLMGDERTLLQILETLRAVDSSRIFALKQQTQIIWNQYLSSLERIIGTTFEIIRDRVKKYTWRDSCAWNTVPGALNLDLDYADDLKRFPFHHRDNERTLNDNFTAVIYVQSGMNAMKSTSLSSYWNSPLFRLVKTAGSSRYISKILIIWDSGKAIPKIWPDVPVTLTIKRSSSKSVSQRFITDGEIETEAVFSLDEDSSLTTDELDFAYIVWKSFPDRIVGYQSRTHYWDDATEMWKYSSKNANDYSMILTGSCVYHTYYHHVYWTKIPSQAQEVVEQKQNCEDILLNMLVTKITNKPPIKLTSKRVSKEMTSRPTANELERFKARHACLNELSDIYGTMPLKRSSVRLDPVLFRDKVSNLRKKYRQLELQQ